MRVSEPAADLAVGRGRDKGLKLNQNRARALDACKNDRAGLRIFAIRQEQR